MTNEELAQTLADLDYTERQDVVRRAEELAEAAYTADDEPHVVTDYETGKARWV